VFHATCVPYFAGNEPISNQTMLPPGTWGHFQIQYGFKLHNQSGTTATYVTVTLRY